MSCLLRTIRFLMLSELVEVIEFGYFLPHFSLHLAANANHAYCGEHHGKDERFPPLVLLVLPCPGSTNYAVPCPIHHTTTDRLY